MEWLPLFHALRGRPCLVAGGGAVALRKTEMLLKCEAQVTVTAPRVDPALAALPVTVCLREVEPGDVEGKALVIDATGERKVGEALFTLCRERNIPLNVVDVPELCTVIFPAVLRRGKLTAAVSTGGASPTAAAWARDRLGEVLPERFEDILEQMEHLRRQARERVPAQSDRAALLRTCFARAVELGRPLDEEELKVLWSGGEPANTGFVWLVGAGCQRRELLTLEGLHALEQADAVVCDDLLPQGILDFASPHAQVHCVGKRQGRHSAGQEEINALLISLAKEGKRVCRLKGGDPFVFGRGGEEALALQAAGVPYRVVPGVTSAVALPELWGIPVTHRGVSRSFHVITAHTAGAPDGLPEDLDKLAQLEGTLVFLMGFSRLEALARRLIEAGRSPDTPAAVVGSKAVRGTLADIAQKAAGLSAPAVIVVGETAAMDLTGEGERG